MEQSQASSAFCACRRFSACSQTTLFGPSITSALISSPRCAGRQCRTRQPGWARASFGPSSWYESPSPYEPRIASRWSRSLSVPMEVHTSVAITSAPVHAARGSVPTSTPPPVCAAIRAAASSTAASGW